MSIEYFKEIVVSDPKLEPEVFWNSVLPEAGTRAGALNFLVLNGSFSFAIFFYFFFLVF